MKEVKMKFHLKRMRRNRWIHQAWLHNKFLHHNSNLKWCLSKWWVDHQWAVEWWWLSNLIFLPQLPLQSLHHLTRCSLWEACHNNPCTIWVNQHLSLTTVANSPCHHNNLECQWLLLNSPLFNQSLQTQFQSVQLFTRASLSTTRSTLSKAGNIAREILDKRN